MIENLVEFVKRPKSKGRHPRATIGEKNHATTEKHTLEEDLIASLRKNPKEAAHYLSAVFMASGILLAVASFSNPVVPNATQDKAKALSSDAGEMSGKKAEEHKSDMRAPLPEDRIALPEYYGFYVVDGKNTVELKAGAEPPSFGAGAEFLLFNKVVARSVGNWQIRKLEFEPRGNGWTRKSETVIICRTKPVRNQPEMVRIIPSRVLEPGAYRLESESKTGLLDLDEQRIRFFADADRMRKDSLDAAHKAAQQEQWREADRQAKMALALKPGDSAARDVARLAAANTLKTTMALIPAGEFDMGGNPDKGREECAKYYGKCERGWFVIEAPVHSAHLEAFYIDKYEVTQEQYESVMGSNPSMFKGGDLPVDSVSWHEADGYCRKVGKRLPTEAEWEKAARAGTTTQYYWGDDGNQTSGHAWFSGNADKKTHPVGQKPPNAWGVYDMAGNVWEWVADWYGKDYKSSPRDNPQGPANGQYRVLRGGSWNSLPFLTRPASRERDEPGYRDFNLGFRCVQ